MENQGKKWRCQNTGVKTHDNGIQDEKVRN
jgi:hypothetical protein